MRCHGPAGFPGGLARLLESPLRFTVGLSELNGRLGRLAIVPSVFLHDFAAHLHKNAPGVLHFFGGKLGRFYPKIYLLQSYGNCRQDTQDIAEAKSFWM